MKQKTASKVIPFRIKLKYLFNRWCWLFIFIVAMAGITACDNDPADTKLVETGTMADIEGNVYKTVKIGDQWWMAENLRVTRFRTGALIPLVPDPQEWGSMSSPARCEYNNAETNQDFLYNFYAVTAPERLAPIGWRIPTDEDWKQLEAYLGMPLELLEETNWRGSTEGDMLKEQTLTTTGWIHFPGVWGLDAYGFHAVGFSCRVYDGKWGVPGLRHSGYWWSSTAGEQCGWFRSLDYQKSGIFRYCAEPTYGFSIRCVKE